MRAKGLRAFDDERAGGIVLAFDGEGLRGFQDSDAVFDKGVYEFDSGLEIGLIGRHDVAAGVAEFGIVQDGLIEIGFESGCAQATDGKTDGHRIWVRGFGSATSGG